jgi:hypothetical protein
MNQVICVKTLLRLSLKLEYLVIPCLSAPQGFLLKSKTWRRCHEQNVLIQTRSKHQLMKIYAFCNNYPLLMFIRPCLSSKMCLVLYPVSLRKCWSYRLLYWSCRLLFNFQVFGLIFVFQIKMSLHRELASSLIYCVHSTGQQGLGTSC